MKSHNVSDTGQTHDDRTTTSAVSHATLMQSRRLDVLSLFINTFFMIIPSHRQGVCTPRQGMILSVEILVCGNENFILHNFVNLITKQKIIIINTLFSIFHIKWAPRDVHQGH